MNEDNKQETLPLPIIIGKNRSFSSFRQKSLKLDSESGHSKEKNNKSEHKAPIQPGKIPPKPKTVKKKPNTRFAPLDPKVYRVTYEEYKRATLKAELQNNRGSSAPKKEVQIGNRFPSTIKKATLKINPTPFHSTTQPNQKEETANKDISEKSIENKAEEEKDLPEQERDSEDKKASIEQELVERKDQCSYCLKQSNNPITLPCTHIICRACIEESVKIEAFTKPFLSQQDSIVKCPKCADNFSLSYPSLNLPLIPSQLSTQATNLSKCDQCQVAFVLFDCLNCDISLCSQCKIAHLSHPEHQHHKVVPYEKENKTSQDITKCSIHQITFEFFCLNDNELICPKCAELLHNEHYYKKLSEVNSHFHEELKKEIIGANQVVDKIKAQLSTLEAVHQTLNKDCSYFTAEAYKYFEDIHNIIYSHQALMQNRIKEWFQLKSKEVSTVIDQLNVISERYKSFINHRPYNNLDKMQQIRNMRSLNELFSKCTFDSFHHLIHYSYQKFSVFRNIPIKSINRLMKKFAFLPLGLDAFDKLNECFKASNIITKEVINSDLLIVLPKITEGRLLYRISESGPSPEEFHSRCNKKGATIMLMKTDTGHIFGGFNPFDWKDEFRYEETAVSFLFSISDGKIRKPMRCKVNKVLKEYAIKQTEKDYSPSFGLADISDLFIAFKNLRNSYSKLGTVYKCPKGYKGNTFLAGRSTDWNILDIEVYSIKYLNDTEYYDMN